MFSSFHPTFWCDISIHCTTYPYGVLPTTIHTHKYYIMINLWLSAFLCPPGKKSTCTSICLQKKQIVWLIYMLACLSFKPYAKSISLCVILVSLIAICYFNHWNQTFPWYSMTILFTSFNPYLHLVNIVCNV